MPHVVDVYRWNGGSLGITAASSSLLLSSSSTSSSNTNNNSNSNNGSYHANHRSEPVAASFTHLRWDSQRAGLGCHISSSVDTNGSDDSNGRGRGRGRGGRGRGGYRGAYCNSGNS
jgi:hypothetical protein